MIGDKYKNLSNFEINKLVAIARGHSCYYGNGSFTNSLIADSVAVKGGGIIGSINFCKDWYVAGRIAEDNDISLLKCENGNWLASFNAYWVDGTEWQIDGVEDKEPCRAICIAFLMKEDIKCPESQ